MNLRTIKVQNFRRLKDMSLDLEDDLSLVIGKNNSGKTSLLIVLDKFLGVNSDQNNFSFDDFNSDFKSALKIRIEDDEETESPFPFLGISLKVFIEYDENDDLANIGNKVIMDLDPENRMVVIAFEYYLTEEKFESLNNDFAALREKKKNDKKSKPDFFDYLRDRHKEYFKLSRKSLEYDIEKMKENNDVFTDLYKEKIQIRNIINFKHISARRNVSNKDSEKALSSLSTKIYGKIEASDQDSEIVEMFKEELSDTDVKLDEVYSKLFKELIEDVKKFGGIKQDDTIIKIVSTLQHKELLEGNTTVMYGLDDSSHSLPENYNGLGYMNLISMIFEIKILLQDFQRKKEEKPADINLLFIEEPEAHTHPQMQYIFIKNIKSLLQAGIKREDGKDRKIQTILSTHSSHIVSESDFDDIKYFKIEENCVVSRNIKDLEAEYGASGAEQYFKFLKQYLTLNRSELFFADKAIFIEGDTERILLPAMMKKLDQEDIGREIEEKIPPSTPLLSQNISIIEVGAYSHIFEKFINFIGVKSLIVTDIDSVKSVQQTDKDGNVEKNADGDDKMVSKAHPVVGSENTSNGALKIFYGDYNSLADFIKKPLEKRVLKRDADSQQWVEDDAGHLVCAYQTEEENDSGVKYHARSFEDAFFHINGEFIRSKSLDDAGEFIGNDSFPNLRPQKHLKDFLENPDSYQLANDGVASKPSFAMEILLNSETDEATNPHIEYSNWNSPAYIKEGLKWLKEK
ncbi:MAG: ATP-dependent endonuclease [Rhodospirillaceae bacterium]|nr:ATP-dependent endonuclease [Rhodospirillaceae bacterium]MBT3886488.1 ATP-dependent endonuclease [Rhodospirillaceae bacterium]MBT4116210.1 ATP-dependent endonuclease [Rhodospirillaceae bacterium]MBT7030915.1 ATP-dependent endonuclease [Rhodospirillaceae bacterium]MBT7571531.1 ATP-dependent endonuclease [Rhodospirillaceae bacterium]